MAQPTQKGKASRAAADKIPGRNPPPAQRATKPESAKPPAYMQAKLAVSQPQDSAEKEADKVARQIASTPKASPAPTEESAEIKGNRASLEPGVTPAKGDTLTLKAIPNGNIPSAPAPDGAMHESKTRALAPVNGKTPVVQRKATDTVAGQQLPADTENRIDARRGSGKPMPSDVEAEMSTRFNQDFSGVGIHTDNEATDLCAETQAQAFTVGNDIFFAPGKFAPETPSGRELLAHELTHVVQQQYPGSAGTGLRFARSPLSDDLRNVLLLQGKGALFERLRNLQVSDPDVLTMVDSDLSGDDQWLARNLVLYGREASWPIHLRVEREMKGWSDCGGKTAVFDMLRVSNGADAGNIELFFTIFRLFAGDDLWLAKNLMLHGREANWPIQLRVEREMKGWSDCGGKTAVFDILRTSNGADAGNVDLFFTIFRLFAGDDLWLAENLMLYGREANWPIHLRIQREMKGWSDCGGKGAVFTILRADGGAHANDADLIATLASIFAAGTEDATLAVLLRKYGPEASWPAPVNEYQCPFDFAPQSSPNERILYNGRYSVVPGPDAHYHELEFTAVNGTFDSAAGPAVKTFATGTAANRIDTGNFSFFIPAVFAAGATASVTMRLKQKSTGTVVMTNTWNFTARATAPTTIHQVQANSAVAIGSSYDYNLGPALPGPATAPFYEHQTVLEEFASRTSNLQLGDMDIWWLFSEGITSKAALDAKLFSGSSNNGTFVIDWNDQIHDVHGGGTGMLDNAATHLSSPMQIDVDLPQTYTAGPGNVLGNYTIRRSRKAGGGYELRKFGP